MKNRKIINAIFAIILFGFSIFIINSISMIEKFEIEIETEKDNPKNDVFANSIEELIEKVLLEENNSYADGEFKTSSYIVLDEKVIDEKTNDDNKEKVSKKYVEYLVTMVGNYGFENSILTKVSGSGVIPMVLHIEKNEDETYKIIKVQVPKDGNMYEKSIKEMFPLALHNKVLNTSKFYEELRIEEESKAKEYLRNINREAQIINHVEKELGDIEASISNELLDVFYEYPYWIGTLEKIENGIRYVYEKKIEKEGNCHIITFIKYNYENKDDIVEKYSYKVTNDKIECIYYNSNFNDSSNKETLNNYIINETRNAYLSIYDDVNVHLSLIDANQIDDAINATYNVKVTYHFKNYDKDESEIPYLMQLKKENLESYDVMKEEYKKLQESNSKIRATVKLDKRYKRLIYRNLSANEENENLVRLERDMSIHGEDNWDNYYDLLNHLKDVNNYLRRSNDYDFSYQKLYK